MSHQLFNTELAPTPIGPYSQATIYDSKLIFCSGQICIDPNTNQVVTGGIEEQTHQALKNLSNVLTQSGSSLQHVLKTTVLLHEMSDFDVVNKIYEQYFSPNKPARSTFSVKGLPKGVLVEIEAIAYRPDKVVDQQ
ncbi:hypothetical protein ABK040_011667 [Willaertia magna]